MMAGSTTLDPIPLVSQLADIYSTQRLAKEGRRWEQLRLRFKEKFDGQEASFIARAPGRVNLMGDHVDHMRFSCLPAALEMDILMAFSVKRESQIQSSSSSTTPRVHFFLENTNESFQSTSFYSQIDNHDEVQLDHCGSARWANYFKVAFKGLLPHLPSHLLDSSSRPQQVNVLVDGTIPPESSLSSSAAMTTCSSIVILQAFEARKEISRREMAEVAIESERLVGVNAGGMDQAASIFGVEGSALHVSFVPQLSAIPIQLPPSHPPYMFVIANTLVKSDKKVMGPVQYNLRVGELRMACRALCKQLDLPQDETTEVLKCLMEVYFEKNSLQIAARDDGIVQEAEKKWGEEAGKMVKMREIALSILPDHPLRRDEVEELTGYKGEAFDKEFLHNFPIRADTFKLYARTKHVFEESLMVLKFKAECSSQLQDAEETYKRLGKLMHESQQSLFNVYENGCLELRQVCEITEGSGALGSRPTGAGWGGSTVSLVDQRKVKDVLEALREQYYNRKYPGITDDAFNDAVLVSQPAGGACLYQV